MRYLLIIGLLSLGGAAQSQKVDPTDERDCGIEKVVIGTQTPGVLPAIVGERIPSPIGSYKICRTYTIDGLYGAVSWGDRENSRSEVIAGAFQGKDNGRLNASHTYTAGGRYEVFAKIHAACRDAGPEGEWKATSCGRGTAIVYEPSPITSFAFIPSATVRGGLTVKARVVTSANATGQGILVRITSSAATANVPDHVVIAPGGNVASFDVRTQQVASVQNVVIVVNAGSGEMSQSVSVVP